MFKSFMWLITFQWWPKGSRITPADVARSDAAIAQEEHRAATRIEAEELVEQAKSIVRDLLAITDERLVRGEMQLLRLRNPTLSSLVHVEFVKLRDRAIEDRKERQAALMEAMCDGMQGGEIGATDVGRKVGESRRASYRKGEVAPNNSIVVGLTINAPPVPPRPPFIPSDTISCGVDASTATTGVQGISYSDAERLIRYSQL